MFLLPIGYFIFGLRCISANFLHEPSYVVLSPGNGNTFDFGFSLAYSEKYGSLVSGAPHADLNGAVYSCPVVESLHNQTVICSKNDINIDKLAQNYSREQSPEQNFCLGASLAVSKSYIFTCAPLWSKDITTLHGDHIYGAFGTCFVSDDDSKRYNGLLEQYEMRNFKNIEYPPTFDDIYGGVGWSTLVDDANDLILIAKPILTSSISYMPASMPLSYSKKVVPLADVSGLRTYMYKGRALAAGNFFNDYGTVYAISMEKDNRFGAVAFLRYDQTLKSLSVLMRRNRAVLFENKVVGAMFGCALHAVDMNGDNYSELIVGAPGEPCWERGVEVGAIYFYMGGIQAKRKQEAAALCIFGKEDNSRLGTAITSLDLNEDNYPEIFISAPYEENEGGVIYVLSGYELNKRYLKYEGNSLKVSLSELSYVQRIRNHPFSTFGYSLQVLPDFDREGGNALAIGSPASGRVVMYRSIPSITVTISNQLMVLNETVRELDTNFTIRVVTTVIYPKRVNVTAKLFHSVTVTANGAKSVDPAFFIINLSSSKETVFNNDVVVHLYDSEPGLYKFEAEVRIDEATLVNKVFDSSLVRFSEQSKTKTVRDVTRICGGDECIPKLSIAYDWSGGKDQYVLGSSNTEIMTVNVWNEGTKADVSCAWIRVSGAKVAVLECDRPDETWYKCNFLNLDRHEKRSLDIVLDMSKLTNKDEKLHVGVLLYNMCESSKSNATFKEIRYELNPNEIFVDGQYQDQNVTASKIQSEDNSNLIESTVLYSITNKGSVLWESVIAQFYVNEIFMKNLTITSPYIRDCGLDIETNLTYSCVLDLKPYSNVKIIASVKISRKNIMKFFKNNELSIRTVLNLKLFEDAVKTKVLTSSLFYQNDITIGQNRTVIILIACILAAMLLIVAIYGLYKAGFFKRTNKKKLDVLRASIRRPPPKGAGSSDSPQTANSGEIIEPQNCISEEDPAKNEDTEEDSVSVLKDISPDGNTATRIAKLENKPTQEDNTKS